jgi:uncharacterized protein YeeX (DUF496 family)
MLKDYEKAVDDFMLNRIIDVGNTILLNNEKYIDLNDKLGVLYNEIIDHLPEEYKHLLDEFEVTSNSIGNIVEDTMYNQGFKDSIELRNILKITA